GGNTTGLSKANFQLKSNGIVDAKLVSISGTGNEYTATIYTGKGEGYIQLGIVNDENLIPGLQGLPYFDIDTQWIDKTGPIIKKLIIPNQSMRGGDTVPILIHINPEKTNCKLFQGNINNYEIQPIKKETDSTYSSYFIIPTTGTEILAKDPIPVSIILQDSLGNKTDVYNLPIEQNNDPIDFHKPIQLSFNSISDTLLKAGDTLKLVIQFNEPVNLDANSPTNYIPVTIGSRVKNVLFAFGNNTSSLQFHYTIQAGETDKDGIRIASSFSAKNLMIKDIAGNTASLSIQSLPIQHIKVDAIVPEFTNPRDTSITVCASNSTLPINEILKVNNKETNELLTWRLVSPPNTLLINKLIHQQSSSASSITPIDFFVGNPESFKGIDSASFSVSDGINVIVKKIYFNSISIESINSIQSNQEICSGTIPNLLTGTIKSNKDSAAIFLWEQSTTNDSTGFTLANGKNNEINYQPTAQSRTSWWRRKLILNTCTNTSNIVQISMAKNSLWLGKMSTDWNNPTNWCGNIIPSDSAEIIIPFNTTYSPSISIASSVSVRSIQMNKGARLVINGGLFIINNIAADSGAINAINGTIVLKGNALQSLNGHIFENNQISELQINNGSGVSLNNKIIISKMLRLSKGTLFTNNQLTLLNKAQVGSSANGTSINGNVVVEQHFSTLNNGKYLVGHPFNQSISINQINHLPNQFFHLQTNNQDSTNLLKVWQPFNMNTLNENNQWKQYQGILLKLDSNNAGAGLKSNFTGWLNHGSQEMNLTKWGNNGLNIIANPFVSPIKLHTISKGSNVGNHYWLWNPKQGLNGGYTAISSTQNYILNPFEAFIAEARYTSDNQLLIAEESKTNNWNNSTSISYVEENKYHAVIGLYTDNLFWDQFVLIDHGSNKNSFDSTDAIKLPNPDVNIFSHSSDLQKLSIDARRINNTTMVPLQIESTITQPFYFKVLKAILPSDNKLVLHDRLTNQYLPLVNDSIYAFTLSDDSVKNKNRFEISQFIPKGNMNQLLQLLTIKIHPNPVKNELTVGIKSSISANTSFQIYSSAGILIKTIAVGTLQSGTIQIPVSELHAGTYILQVINGEHQRSLTFIKQ
ncbi:MAG: T9SS C-terminal target domain-containing protein, partial [Sphingobacteriia bacterium]